VDPITTSFNDSAQESSFRMTTYDSGKVFYKNLVYILYFDNFNNNMSINKIENEYDTQSKDFNASSVTLFEESLFYINKYTLSGRLVCILENHLRKKISLQINIMLLKIIIDI